MSADPNVRDRGTRRGIPIHRRTVLDIARVAKQVPSFPLHRTLQLGAVTELLDHAEERMIERDIDMIDVLKVLRIGDIVGPIEPGISEHEWKCKVTASPRYPETAREIGVVTIVVRSSRLLIKTVEWEDER